MSLMRHPTTNGVCLASLVLQADRATCCEGFHVTKEGQTPVYVHMNDLDSGRGGVGKPGLRMGSCGKLVW